MSAIDYIFLLIALIAIFARRKPNQEVKQETIPIIFPVSDPLLDEFSELEKEVRTRAIAAYQMQCKHKYPVDIRTIDGNSRCVCSACGCILRSSGS